MKIFKTILSGSLALALLSQTYAQQNKAPQITYIRITGSTAFQAALNQAIQNYVFAPGYFYGYTGPTLNGSREAIFTGNTIVGGYPVVIKTAFIGSVSGISILAKDLTVQPDPWGVGWLVDYTPQSTTGSPYAPQNFDNPMTADVAMADCYQVSAPKKFRTPVLTDTIVGVVAYEWVLTPGRGAYIYPGASLTSAEVSDCLVNGKLHLSAISHSKNDTEKVQGVGLDEDSGTRIQALACSGIKIGTHLMQYEPLYDGSLIPTNNPPGTQITGAVLWPLNIVYNMTYPTGDSGYPTGGQLAAAVNVPHNTPSYPNYFYENWFLSYLGINDAATVTIGTILEFNGFAYSPGAVAIGQYTYWGYEHLFYRTSFSGTGKTVADQISSYITNYTASISGVPLSAMQVHRDADGGPIVKGGTP